MDISLHLNAVHQNLLQLAHSPDFWRKLAIIFGAEFDRAKAEQLQQQWQAEDFSQLPTIRVLDQGMAGLLGAYAQSTDTIYLNQNFLETASPEQVQAVLLEEIGHAIDARLNLADSPGDEGEIFANVVSGVPLDKLGLQSLRSQADHFTIFVDGYAVPVEAATFSASNFAELVTAINSANNSAGPDVIEITGNIQLTDFLPLITSDIEFIGNGHTISGDANNNGINDEGDVSDVSIFFIKEGTVSISNLTLSGGRAQGGKGGDGISGGGGGMGAGGALFIDSGNITVTNVTFSDNQAIGGSGGAGTNSTAGGGGGGLRDDASGSIGGTDGGGDGGDIFLDDGDNGGFGGGGGGSPGGTAGNGGFGGGGGGGASFNPFAGDGGFGAGRGRTGAEGGGGGGAGLGGAIFIRSGTLILDNTTFNNNSAVKGDAGIGSGSGNGKDGKGLGGAIFAVTDDLKDEAGVATAPTVLSLGGLPTFTNNTAADNGGDSTGITYNDGNIFGTLEIVDFSSVDDFTELVNAINFANSLPGSDVIEITGNIQLTDFLPLITSDIEFIGNGHTISGDANNNGINDEGDVSIFFVKEGTVSISNLTFSGGRAQGGRGGNGVPGGGGGMGAGGALLINSGNVTLTNVTFSDNQAIGGAGGLGVGGLVGGGGSGGSGETGGAGG
ncbi:hypothetical protein IQ225_12055, partial [Synechocystis salina LEGE 06155]|nr:hypothetical protein [Synechocystis salina LEGE 06155]